MESARWQRIKTVYREALDLPPDERSDFVHGACADDPALAAEVLKLLEVPSKHIGSMDDAVREAAADFEHIVASSDRVGPYRLLDIIGQGGMGHVYLAERADDEYEQRVAIKMANWLGASPELIERFRLERQILAHLEHPNIARLLDGGRTDTGVPYLVMEFVDGRSILDYGKDEALTLRQRLELFLKICNAVQYAHSKLVIHRDLKPSNVLVKSDGTPKLLDFGIAKLMDSNAGGGLTRADMRILTPEYASPEQMLGAPVTTATDIYGLGLMLYQLLSGSLPFDLSSRTSLQIRDLVCNTVPDSPSVAAAGTGNRARSAQLRGDLDNIVMIALRKEPERRYATVKDLADDIRNFLGNKPVAARGDDWSYRTGKFLRRHRIAVVATTAVVLAALVQTLFYTQKLAEERDYALEERRVAESTTNFLVDLFNVSDPGQAAGADISAREVLDLGAVRIRNELTEDNAIRARMLQTIGRVYERLGLYDDAEALMEEAVGLNRELYTPRDRLLIDSLDELAWLYYRRENWKAAFDTASEALELQREVAGGDGPTMARTLNHLGTITYYLDDYDASLDYYQRALAVLNSPEWQKSELRGTTLNHLGIVYDTLGQHAESERMYLESLDIRINALGENHPDTATAFANLGSFYSNAGDFDKAREYALKGLAIDRKTKGEAHADVAYDLTLLGNIESLSGKPQAALPYILEASTIWQTAAGARHSRYARSLDLLSENYRKLDRFAEAEAAGKQSLDILASEYGATHTLTSNPLFTLGKVYFDMDNFDQARSNFERALQIRSAAFGDQHREVWSVMHMLVKTDIANGNHEAAHQRAAQALELIQAAKQTEVDVYGWLTALHQQTASAE